MSALHCLTVNEVAEAARLAKQTREAQGLPPNITDPDTLEHVAAIIGPTADEKGEAA